MLTDKTPDSSSSRYYKVPGGHSGLFVNQTTQVRTAGVSPTAKPIFVFFLFREKN